MNAKLEAEILNVREDLFSQIAEIKSSKDENEKLILEFHKEKVNCDKKSTAESWFPTGEQKASFGTRRLGPKVQKSCFLIFDSNNFLKFGHFFRL